MRKEKLGKKFFGKANENMFKKHQKEEENKNCLPEIPINPWRGSGT